jgi:hypothetical protein
MSKESSRSQLCLFSAMFKYLPEVPLIIQFIRRRRMASSGMLRRVTLVRTDVSEELSACFIRVARIGELGTTQAVGY